MCSPRGKGCDQPRQRAPPGAAKGHTPAKVKVLIENVRHQVEEGEQLMQGKQRLGVG
jgi:hypothetical protein